MLRPRVKPEHRPYRLADGRVRLGGTVYGIAAELGDDTGVVWSLLSQLDGSRTREEAAATVARSRPGVPVEELLTAVGDLCDSGYLEDAAAPEPAGLSAAERERYDRSRRFFRWVDLTPRASTWEPQLALKAARVTVVGLGGTGGTAALCLAASGVGRLTLVDADTVVLSNLSRQVVYTEDDLGRAKVAAAADRLGRLNSDVSVRGLRRRVGSVADLAELAADCDVLVLAADEPFGIRGWANRACLATGTPWVDAGYHGPLILVGTYVPGSGGCYECVRAAERDERAAAGTEPVDDTAPFPLDNAVSAASAGISGCLVAHAAVALVTGVPAPEAGRVQAVNLVALDSPYELVAARRPGCPACGDG